MGQSRTSEVQRDARIGEAECNRDCLIETALAEETRLEAKLLNDTEIELYKRNFELKKSTDLFNMGISIISYTLREIKDEESYMESMGQSRTSEVLRDARIGEAECNRDCLIETALAEETRLEAKLLNDT